MKSTEGIPIKLILAIAILMTASFLIFVFNSKKLTSNNTLSPITEVITSNNGSTIETPKRLKIPSIAVDAAILSASLASDGSMDAPKGAFEVTWFNLGKKPGDLGSAVITGHYGTWKNGSVSVFDNLHKLKKGDKIYVEDEKGTTISFIVRESRNYDPTADAVDVFSSDDERSHLNLVTCEGIWNEDAKSFSKRLVVFTDRE